MQLCKWLILLMLQHEKSVFLFLFCYCYYICNADYYIRLFFLICNFKVFTIRPRNEWDRIVMHVQKRASKENDNTNMKSECDDM